MPWDTDADGGQALAEFAGRACYQSWNKPNPATATNAGYLRHILEVGHLSVLEHGSVTFYLTRRVALADPRADPAPALQLLAAVPALRAGEATPRWSSRTSSPTTRSCTRSSSPRPRRRSGLHRLLEGLEKKFADVEHATLRRKQARQAARAVLPNATETRIVVTGNYRAWRHFVAMRASEHADVEIRALAVACLRELQRIAPNAFADFDDHRAARRHRGRLPARSSGRAERAVVGSLASCPWT